MEKIPEMLYHGTCQIFINLARQQRNQFGPDYDRIYFVENKNHAMMFAESWATERGKKKLESMFNYINPEDTKPVTLEFETASLNNLKSGFDGDEKVYYIERGPVPLSFI